LTANRNHQGLASHSTGSIRCDLAKSAASMHVGRGLEAFRAFVTQPAGYGTKTMQTGAITSSEGSVGVSRPPCGSIRRTPIVFEP
jgi:hypothetical protein